MLRSLTSWRRDRERIPLADQIVPLIAQAGPQGMSRGKIGRLVELERDLLDQLLTGMVSAGLLAVSKLNGVRFYRLVR